MLFGLFPYKQLIVLTEPKNIGIAMDLAAGFGLADDKVFPIEVLGSPIVYDTQLDEAGERSEVKGLSFTALLYDNSQFGNHQLWSTEVTKEEKLLRLHGLYEMVEPLTGKKKIWGVANEALNNLGIKLVRITRLQSRISRDEIAVVIDCDVQNPPQQQANARSQKKMADGTEFAATQVAKTAALTKSAQQAAEDASIWAKAEAVAKSTFEAVGGWFEG